jgi:phage shock protein PspC (stress-responsive transcriptional regulator)
MSLHDSKSSSLTRNPNRQTKLFRTSSGSVVSGVCSGLQACGKGTAVGWRILFVLLGLYGIGIVGYVIMALVLPKATPEEEEDLLNQVVVGDSNVTSIDKIQYEMERVQSMKDSGLINEEEYSSLRKKILGI